LKGLERATGIEPATRSLGSYCSTTELHPRQELLTCPHGCEKRRFTEHCLSSSKLGCVENGCVICSAEVPASFHVLTHGGRRIQPSSLALSLATPHARSRNSTGVIGASSSSPMLCEVLIPGPSASLRNVTSYFVPGKLITISPSCISSFRRGSFIGVSVGGHCGKPLPLST
jgi:hypothetical protein